MVFIIILGSLALIEVMLSPRLDTTDEGDVLLWYNGYYGRNYFKLW